MTKTETDCKHKYNTIYTIHHMHITNTYSTNKNNKGYDLYTDRFYTSSLLADALKQMGITVTGTVLSNKRELPVENCVVCSDRSEERRLTLLVCQTCPENPALCPDKYFNIIPNRYLSIIVLYLSHIHMII